MNRIRSHAKRAAIPAAALALGLALSSSAFAATSTQATMNWSTFTVTTTDAGFGFLVDPSYGTTATAYTQAFAPNFTASVSAGDSASGVSATGSASLLAASIVSVSGPGYAARSADITRAGDFNLDAGASVTFSIMATVGTNDAANAATTSFASLSVLGSDYQVSSLNLLADGTSQSRNGTLSLTVTNTSNVAVTDYLAVEGTVNVAAIQPVPEPASALLMLPGLLAGGFVLARGRAARG